MFQSIRVWHDWSKRGSHEPLTSVFSRLSGERVALSVTVSGIYALQPLACQTHSLPPTDPPGTFPHCYSGSLGVGLCAQVA